MTLALNQNPASAARFAAASDGGAAAPGERPAATERRIRSFALAPLKAVWRLLRPLRQPVVSRVDQHIAAVLRADLNVISDQLNQFAVQTAQAQQQSLIAMREMNLFVEGLVREIAQLQEQVQTLSQACAQLAPAAAGRFAPWTEDDGDAAAAHDRFDRREINT